MNTVAIFALLASADQLPRQTETSASVTITSGDRVRIGTSRDVIQIQGVLLSASQVVLPSAPVPEGKKLELQDQLPKSKTVEKPKPTLPPSSADRKPER